jgi:hypothetical protein
VRVLFVDHGARFAVGVWIWKADFDFIQADQQVTCKLRMMCCTMCEDLDKRIWAGRDPAQQRADKKAIVRHHAAPRSARGWLSIQAVISSCRQYRRLQR